MATTGPRPLYHDVVGSNVTVYLDVSVDTDGDFPTDNMLAQIASQWGSIMFTWGLTLTVALNSAKPPPQKAPPLGILVTSVAAPPAGINFFNLTFGRGANADPFTRSARISSVSYSSAQGYIYHINGAVGAFFVPAMSHELGHILGLSDRYYEAVAWLTNWAIDRTCLQIRNDNYIVGQADYRDGLDGDKLATKDLPRLAFRVSLPIAKQGIPDPNYDPVDNLMSVSNAVLTQGQINVILAQADERKYKKINWVAILGGWRRHMFNEIRPAVPAGAFNPGPDCPGSSLAKEQWPFPAWEAGPTEEGRGLLFLPGPAFKRYPCVSLIGSARDKKNNEVNPAARVAAQGRGAIFSLVGSAYKYQAYAGTKHKMCHSRHTMNDLMRM